MNIIKFVLFDLKRIKVTETVLNLCKTDLDNLTPGHLHCPVKTVHIDL